MTVKAAPKWLTHAEAADFVGTSRAFLYKLTTQKRLAFQLLGGPRGGLRFYRIEDLQRVSDELDASGRRRIRKVS